MSPRQQPSSSKPCLPGSRNAACGESEVPSSPPERSPPTSTMAAPLPRPPPRVNAFSRRVSRVPGFSAAPSSFFSSRGRPREFRSDTTKRAADQRYLAAAEARARLGDGRNLDEEDLLIAAEEDRKAAEAGGDQEAAAGRYDWREEWYPLYLTAEVPEDAPLGLAVFDKQLVLFKDGHGVVRCYEDRCPHRLAKLSEGQIVDGRLECLYHGWQFAGGGGRCVKIPQLPEGARIPRSACVRAYEARDSQGVVWVWMSEKNRPDASKLPWFEHYARPGFRHVSTIHELPYDHSILLENFMDPAHVPISHDRTDFYSRREDAQPLSFEVTDRSVRGFAGVWRRSRAAPAAAAGANHLRFDAPCVLQNNHEAVDKAGEVQHVSALFLCRPTGQGRSMVIVRFGTTAKSPVMKLFPPWLFHQNICKVLEQDMGFLSSQNEVLLKEKVPTGKLYINLRSCDTWVAEYRRWKDRAGHGMPYYFRNSTVSLPSAAAVVEQSPAGLVAGTSASRPAKGEPGSRHAPNPINRYFRHVVHCGGCRGAVRAFQTWGRALYALAALCGSLAVLASRRRWQAALLLSACLLALGGYACAGAREMMTTNFTRSHRRL